MTASQHLQAMLKTLVSLQRASQTSRMISRVVRLKRACVHRIHCRAHRTLRHSSHSRYGSHHSHDHSFRKLRD